MDTGVFFVVHVWRDARGFHATARDVMCEHDNEFDSPKNWRGFSPRTSPLRLQRQPEMRDRR